LFPRPSVSMVISASSAFVTGVVGAWELPVGKIKA
jgi:hypothetical protein